MTREDRPRVRIRYAADDRAFASDAEDGNEDSRPAHLGCGFEEVGLIHCFRKDL